MLVAFGRASNLIVCHRALESAVTVLEAEDGTPFVAVANALRAPDDRMVGIFTPLEAEHARDLAATLMLAADAVDGGKGVQ
jgi:hypothetical protein